MKVDTQRVAAAHFVERHCFDCRDVKRHRCVVNWEEDRFPVNVKVHLQISRSTRVFRRAAVLLELLCNFVDCRDSVNPFSTFAAGLEFGLLFHHQRFLFVKDLHESRRVSRSATFHTVDNA